MGAKRYIIDDTERLLFKVNRSALVNPEIHDLEQEMIFSKCWIYVGHESELGQANDFKTRYVAGRPVIFCRDSEGRIRTFLNSCTHRGTIVCREPEGSAKTFRCFYHAWTFNNKGELIAIPADDAYGPCFDRSKMGLKEVPRLEHYKGFYFVNFDENAESLFDYLAGAKEYIDLIVDQSPTGEVEIIEGSQEFDIQANWKLMAENSVDFYHLFPTHITFVEYMKDSGTDFSESKGPGLAKDLGNGHIVIEKHITRGRPIAVWMPMYGEEAKAEIDAIRQELNQRLGEERAMRVAETTRNLVIFPNLVINDGSSITVRTFFSTGVNKMKVSSWALGPKNESPTSRARRLDSYLTFFGPGGLATPDDVEALEMAQKGYETWREIEWSDMSRGMNRERPLENDEHHLRAFWRRWNQIITGTAANSKR